jgi:Kynureninase (EC 3.7.1.3)
VIVADSTSINLFKALAGGLALRPDRRVIVSERENFPTDLYMAQGLNALLGSRHELRLAEADAIAEAIAGDTAVVLLTHVNYRTGRMHDLAGLTRCAHERGALVIWDLAHSTGAVPVDLNGAGADFAIGCGYKYLNGGGSSRVDLQACKLGTGRRFTTS